MELNQILMEYFYYQLNYNILHKNVYIDDIIHLN